MLPDLMIGKAGKSHEQMTLAIETITVKAVIDLPCF